MHTHDNSYVLRKNMIYHTLQKNNVFEAIFIYKNMR